LTDKVPAPAETDHGGHLAISFGSVDRAIKVEASPAQHPCRTRLARRLRWKLMRMTQSVRADGLIQLGRRTMSSIAIKDIIETTVLDQAVMAAIAGGTDVHIDSMSTTVRSTDDQSPIGPNLLGALVNTVIDGIRQQSQKPRPR
jgi:hypothetical protein